MHLNSKICNLNANCNIEKSTGIAKFELRTKERQSETAVPVR